MTTLRRESKDRADWMPLHVGDWLASGTVAAISPAGEAAYLRLLMHQWRNEADGLPGAPAELRKLTRATPAEWRATWPYLEQHFPLDPDGKRRNPRLQAERLHVNATRAERSESGKKGNAKRWNQLRLMGS